MSEDNFTLSGDNLELIYQKLWSVRSILSLLEDRLSQNFFNGELVQTCFVLVDLLNDIEALLPEL